MQVCRELDMTYQTLKFYCNEGVIPNVKRDHNNRRVFDEKDVKWIKDLTCLKKCGMYFFKKHSLKLARNCSASIKSNTLLNKIPVFTILFPGSSNVHAKKIYRNK